MTSQIVFAEPVRTAIGTFAGALKDVPVPPSVPQRLRPQSPVEDFDQRRSRPSSWGTLCKPATR